ncbi:MAG: hypothetical protein HY297_04675 [Thaumarchaeota archaeon]|nr:hypothetical protein [Nitrososphaerota archaeon]
MGTKDCQLDGDELEASEIIDLLRSRSLEKDPGFTKYNTLMMISDGEAFVPASAGRTVRNGEKVVLIPFSHGG